MLSPAEAIERHRAIPRADRAALEASLASRLRAFLAVCEVVAYAHSKRIVHGDIKPLNILTDDFGATRLIDWGLARVADEGEEAGGGDADRRPRRTPHRHPHRGTDVHHALTSTGPERDEAPWLVPGGLAAVQLVISG